MSALGKLRVFAAIELPPELTERLAGIMAELGPMLPRKSIRWARAEGIHLTLKFYGEVASDRLPALQQSLKTAAASAHPMSLEAGSLGVFPNPFRPRVLWVGLAGDVQNLRALQIAIDALSTPLGFKPEARDFTPHLTLGRFHGSLRLPEREKLVEALKDPRYAQFGALTAETLSLIRSNLKPGGAVYTRLFAAPLGISPNT